MSSLRNRPGAWRPLLSGARAAQALEVARELVGVLVPPAPDVPRAPKDDVSIAGGAAGHALVHGFFARAFPDQGHEVLAERWLDRAIDGVAETEMSPFLYAGFSGVALATEILTGAAADESEDPNAEIDEALAAMVQVSPWPADYDLISGLVGIGQYAAVRRRRAGARLVLERVLERLDELAKEEPEGLTFFTPPAHLIPYTRDKHPNGYYNLGLAHGVPGVVALCAQALEAGIAPAIARRLLEGSVSWLLAQRLPEDAGARFAPYRAPEAPRTPSRSAWCYGDPGVAAALLRAARATGSAEWEREALALAHGVIARPLPRIGVADAGICHGAAGLAHVFNRLYQASGDPALEPAAQSWLDRTLAMRRPGQGLGGYQSLEAGFDQADRWIDDPSLLTGVGGIALVLLAAATPIAPDWDALLMLGQPPVALGHA